MTITSSEPRTKPVRVRRAAWLVFLWLLVLPGTAWALIRLGGWERGGLVQLFAFTAYVAAWSVVPLIAALATRRWLAAAVAAVTVGLFAVMVLPRALADGDRGPQNGVTLTVMTSNMLFGGADATELVRLVRENDVAVLAVQEFTPAGRDSLKAAGLGPLLPYSSLGPEFGASGSGLYSRFPITDPGVRQNGGGFHPGQRWRAGPERSAGRQHPGAARAGAVEGRWGRGHAAAGSRCSGFGIPGRRRRQRRMAGTGPPRRPHGVESHRNSRSCRRGRGRRWSVA